MNSFINIQIRVMTAQAQQQIAAVSGQIAAMNSQWGSATHGVSRFGRGLDGLRLESFGSRIQWIGRQLEYNFTLPILLAGGAATKFALDNEAAMARVVKVYGDAQHGADFYAQEIKSLEGAFRGLSDAFGVNQAATIRIAADWAAAGSSGLALAKAVKLTLQTMILGEMEAAEATQALISIQAQYGIEIDKLTEAIEVLNVVENETAISLQGLVEGFGRAAGIARSAGVDVRHLAALLAALTPAAGSAATAGNALKTIFSRLLAPTRETAEILGLMGINMSDVSWKSAGMVERLGVLATKFEGLSDSQKNVVSSVIASRWQVNRFDILMREILNPIGYYQKALDATVSSQDNFNQMQHELNTVLTSNPRRLQIIWTMLQNAAADIIQPMIPLILYLAQSVQKLVQWFSELDPGIQKLVLGFVAFLAILGVAVRLFGAMTLLAGIVGHVFGFMVGPIAAVSKGLWSLVTVPLVWFFTRASILITGLLALISNAFPAMVRAARTGWFLLLVAWRVGLAALWAVQVAFFAGARAAWQVFLVGLAALQAAWGSVMLPIWAAAMRGFTAILLAGAAAAGIIWRGMLTAMTVMFTRAFWVGILANFVKFLKVGLLPVLRTAGTAIVAAATGPWGIAVAVIVGIVIVFWDWIVAAFWGIVDGVKAAWNALPQAIQGALLAVVRTVAAAVNRVRELLSYLNPWARHSPSLVDNVTTGVAEIVRQFSLLNNVGSIFGRAGVSIQRFAQDLHSARVMADDLQWDRIQKEIAEFAPSLSGQFGNLRAVLNSLRSEMSGLVAEWDTEAFKAMSDAIFENEMATKQLQLQLMDMEDAVGPMSELEARMAAIHGQMELLSGERTALRDAGAGSEILSQYDDQLAALEDQKSVIEEQLAPMRDIANQIEQLRRESERLQLQQSLQFDPIRREADELADAISRVEDALNSLGQVAAEAQRAAQAAGGLGGAGSNFLDAAGGNIPDVGGFDQIGREGGIEDQSALIDQFTADLAKETANLFGVFDFLQPIKDGWNKAWEWLKTNFGPPIQAFWTTFTSWFSGLGNPFDGLNLGQYWDTIVDIWDSVKSAWETVWAVLKPGLTELKDALVGAWNEAVEKIGPKLEEFKDLIEPMGEAFKNLWEFIKPGVALIGGALLAAFSIIVNVLANVVGPIFSWLIDIIGSIIDIVRGVIKTLVGIFTGDWKMAWEGLVDIVGGVWDAIWSTLKNAVLLIWGVIKGLVEGIVDFFVGLWNTLVGNSIIPDIVNGIIDWFTTLWNVVEAIWKALWAAIKWVWDNIAVPAFNVLKAVITSIIETVKKVVDKVKEHWDRFKAAVQLVRDKVREIVDNIKSKWNEITGAVSSVVNNVKTKIDEFVDKITGIRGRIAGAFGGLFDGLSGAFRSAVNWIIGRWNGLRFTIGPISLGPFGQLGPWTMNTPDLAYLAKGGLIARQAMAIVGEGRKGYPEYVIPTDPAFRARALMLFAELAQNLGVPEAMRNIMMKGYRGAGGLGVPFMESGGVLGARGGPRGRAMVVKKEITEKHYHLYGNLEFPNVEGGDDAEEFVRNLEALLEEL